MLKSLKKVENTLWGLWIAKRRLSGVALIPLQGQRNYPLTSFIGDGDGEPQTLVLTRENIRAVARYVVKHQVRF